MPDRAHHAERLRRHLESIVGDRDVTEGVEAAVHDADPRMTDLALRGVEHIAAGTEFDDEEAGAMEAIVLPAERPVVDIIDDAFGDLPAPWSHLGAAAQRGIIQLAIPSVGRIELVGHPTLPYGGTGFIVGDGLLMTNRHVAALFATGLGVRALRFVPGVAPGIDFKQEVVPAPSFVVNVDEVVMIHPHWDCALLRVHDLPTAREPLVLSASEPDAHGRDIVVIGYPAKDTRNDVDLQDRIFRQQFHCKRLQPGRLGPARIVRSFGHDVESVTHDSSTLGGNSGSLVLDTTTGRVLGLHFAGRYLDANFAVPAWALAADPRVVDAGVRFDAPAAPVTTPAFAAAWVSAGAGTGEAMKPQPARRVAPPLRADREALELPLDWYERIDDALLLDAIDRDFDGTRARLTAVLGEEDADEVIDDLMATTEEGLFSPDVNPDLPQIVYLHGIMGGHLAKGRGAGARVWLDPLTLLLGSAATKLRLAADGLSGDDPAIALGADGHLRLFYARAARKWRRKGFAVHEVSYDWRKPITTAADRLHALVESHAAGEHEPRFVIAAHSMGGLVAALYAHRHPEWSDRIERAAFAGSPLGGSYAPIEAVLGVYPLLRTLAKVAVVDDLDDFRSLAAGLPGLLDMLPNPELFDDPLDCYTTSVWPSPNVPGDPWLQQAQAVKAALLESPLLARTTGIVSRQHGTVVSVVDRGGLMAAGPRTGPGDGTVPVRAAAVAQLGAVLEGATARHSDLMNDDAVVAGMADLFATGSTEALAALDPTTIDFDAQIEAPIESIDVLEALETPRVEEVRAHAAAGRLTAADVEFLFDPLGSLGVA